MIDYRPETFTQYVKKIKPIWFLKIIWVVAIVFLITIFIFSFASDLNYFWNYCLFIFLGLAIQSTFIYWSTYKIYNLGRQAYLQVKNETAKFVIGKELSIIEFDLLSKNSISSIDVKKPIYDFNQADVIIIEESLILLGKSTKYGSFSCAAPVEIAISNPKTSIAQAKLMDWDENNDKLYLTVKDDNYLKPFKIIFKSPFAEIKGYLENNYGKT